jgi:peptidyl-prolyl cis-trans isomerase D
VNYLWGPTVLEDLRRRRKNVMKNIVAWTMFGAIIVVFIFWGANSKMKGDVAAAGSAAHVNSKTISIAELQEQVENLSRNPYLSQLMQGEGGRRQIEMMAVNQLVNSELAVQAAEKQGVRVPDEKVKEVITSVPAFQEGGRFRRERYDAFLSGTRRRAADFEERLRKDEMVRETERLLSFAVAPSALELEKQKEIEQFKANAEFVTFTNEQLASKITVSDAEVASYLEKAENKTKVDNAFAMNQDEYGSPEQVRARHILVKADKNDPKGLEAAKAKLATVQKRLQAKEDFAKVAKDLSDDPGSKAQGGDLGFFSRGRMVSEFEKAAFGLEPNAISEPVQTEYGFHIIQVLEKKTAQQPNLDIARPQIARKLLAEEKVNAKVAELSELLKKDDLANVQKWVTDLGLKWEETGAFSLTAQSVPKIGNNDQFASAAFTLTEKNPLADEVIRQGEQSFIVKHKAVTQAEKNQPSQPETNQENMKEQLASNRANDAFQRWLTEMRKTSTISINPDLGASAKGIQDAPF